MLKTLPRQTGRVAVIPAPARNSRARPLLWGALFAALLVVYANHFPNGFHFDDAHAVVANPAIRSLANVPRFFTDATTFSHDPAARSYRPLVTLSPAVDYWLGSGLKPFWFHLSTFCWFLVQIVLMYALFLQVLQRTWPHSRNSWIAWFGSAIYALHPASAETVNYIIQRGDLYVAVGMVAGILVYVWKPAWRGYGLYLLPPIAAMFAKPPATAFALFLLAYLLVIDRHSAIGLRPEPARLCVLKVVPAFLVTGAFLWLEKAMTPPTFFHTTLSSFDYWITQPYVALRYFRSFFLPVDLNIDTDLQPFHSLASAPVLAGFAFCVLLIIGATVAGGRAEWRPVSFGLWWFLIGLVPTAVYPLNEVENDHRMFLPFIGLSLAAVWTAARLIRVHSRVPLREVTAAAIVVLAALGLGTHARNEVWRTDESLWRDDIEKSPNNARGHDQLGAALSNMPDGLVEGMAEFRTALSLKPDFANAHVNLGKALMKLPGRMPDAIAELETGLRLDPRSADAHLNFGSALSRTPGRLEDSIPEFREALRLDPDFVEAHYNLGVVLAQLPGRLPEAIREYETALELKPDYAEAHRNLGIALARVPGRMADAVREFEAALRYTDNPAEAHVNLGVALSKLPGRMPEAIAHYEEALRIKPDYAQARRDLASARSATLGRLPEGIGELEAVIRNNPDWAEAHYRLGAALAKVPGRVERAVAEYREALRLNPDDVAAHSSLGIVLAQLPGRLPEAISEFQTAAKLDPSSADVHSNLGLALSRQPDHQTEAIAEFEAAYRIRPEEAYRRTLENLRSANRSITQQPQGGGAAIPGRSRL